MRTKPTFKDSWRSAQARGSRRRPNMKPQSLESHKAKLLARLTPPKAKVIIEQQVVTIYGQRSICNVLLHVWTLGSHIRKKSYVLNKKPLPLNAMIFRALDALVADGKVQVTMPYTEWRTQLALGMTHRRIFKKETQDKAL